MVWNLLEKKRASRFPGAQGRIPNFVGAEKCAQLLDGLDAWRNARVIKANPDSPQRAIRWKALKEGKIVYMAVPRLRDPKPFIELDPVKLGKKPYEASSIKGAFQWGRPVALKEMKEIDLIVCGSVAVTRSGTRVGKGGGYSELEYALAMEAGKIKPQTPVVTSVHNLQIINEPIVRQPHDFSVDFILTPVEVIQCKSANERPRGIYWEFLDPEKIAAIPVLQQLFRKRSK